MHKPTDLQKKLWTSLVFLFTFTALALPLHLVLWLNLDTTSIQEITASNTAFFLNLFGQDVRQDGILIYTSTFIFEFIRDCTAWKSILAFLALVVATPFVTGKSKLIALLWGIPSIYAINLVRTVSTIYIGIVNPETVKVVHTLFWREGLILVIFAMWYLWFRNVRDYKVANYKILEKIIMVLGKAK